MSSNPDEPLDRWGRPWWMADSTQRNNKRWDADLVYILLASDTPDADLTDLERMHLKEYKISLGKK